MNEREKNLENMLRERVARIASRASAGLCIRCETPVGADLHCDACERVLEGLAPLRVFLDDTRETPEGWYRTYNASETIQVISHGEVEELSLDHDLGVDETGYDVVKWLEEQAFVHGKYPISPEKVHVHSANPVGKAKMLQTLERIYRFKNNNFE